VPCGGAQIAIEEAAMSARLKQNSLHQTRRGSSSPMYKFFRQFGSRQPAGSSAMKSLLVKVPDSPSS
jgi:hypothetical protein